MRGEVIGINNSIASNGGGNEGVGFSIPINLARWIMNELILHGRVSRGALGVDLQHDFTQEDAVTLGMERPRGAWILKVYQASPADKAGIRSGDVVLRFGGVDVVDLNHLINVVSMAAVGESVDVTVWRQRQEVKLKVTVGDRDHTLHVNSEAPADRELDSSGLVRRPRRPNTGSSFALGLELATLNPQLAKRFDLPETWRGALVLSVEPESPLARLMLPADVISAIDSEVIQSSEQAAKVLTERADHVQSLISLDRLVNGVMERQTVRVP